MITPFIVTTRIRLSRTDAAGVVFFPQALIMAHEAYEQFMDDHDCSLTSMMASGLGFPIVQASVSWLSPLRLGDDVAIALHTARIGSTSFALHHTLTANGVVSARCDTVHVCLQQGTKASVPDGLRAALSSLPPAVPSL